jgi:hypothetical protein
MFIYKPLFGKLACCTWGYGNAKPVIATNIVGNKDIVVPNETFWYNFKSILNNTTRRKHKGNFWEKWTRSLPKFLVMTGNLMN